MSFAECSSLSVRVCVRVRACVCVRIKTRFPPPRDGSLGRRFRTCGVVSSSGTISGLGLGAEIDANEAVFRFNDAPTTGFEDDVGSKTTFRFVNSKVVAWDQFNFVTNPIYRQPGTISELS